MCMGFLAGSEGRKNRVQACEDWGLACDLQFVVKESGSGL